jgi:hypothetical protein
VLITGVTRGICRALLALYLGAGFWIFDSDAAHAHESESAGVTRILRETLALSFCSFHAPVMVTGNPAKRPQHCNGSGTVPY